MKERAAPPTWCTPWPTTEQRHLLQVLFGPDRLALEQYRAWHAAIDLDQALDPATHRLLPLLERRLRDLGIREPALGRYAGSYRRSLFDNSVLFHAISAVLARLAGAGIATMLLKGAPLAFLHYADHATRPMSDVDLVVHAADVPRAEAIIAAVPGWQRKDLRTPDLDRLYKHSLTFANARSEIDLHWYWLREMRGATAEQWVWEAALPFDFGGVATRRPSTTALLFSVVLHGLRGNSFSPIRWIADAVQLLRHDADAVDWDDLVAFAQAQRVTRRLGIGLRYLDENFDLPIPAEVTGRLLATRQGMVERIENSLYLADPARYVHSLSQRMTHVAAEYVAVTGARSGLGLAIRLATGLPHFIRYRRDVGLAKLNKRVLQR